MLTRHAGALHAASLRVKALTLRINFATAQPDWLRYRQHAVIAQRWCVARQWHSAAGQAPQGYKFRIAPRPTLRLHWSTAQVIHVSQALCKRVSCEAMQSAKLTVPCVEVDMLELLSGLLSRSRRG